MAASMTLKDAKRVVVGTRINHRFIVGHYVYALGPAQIDGLKWRIPVDHPTTCSDAQGDYITGLRGYCWEVAL